jgi:hypothetical protein
MRQPLAAERNYIERPPPDQVNVQF